MRRGFYAKPARSRNTANCRAAPSTSEGARYGSKMRGGSSSSSAAGAGAASAAGIAVIAMSRGSRAVPAAGTRRISAISATASAGGIPSAGGGETCGCPRVYADETRNTNTHIQTQTHKHTHDERESSSEHARATTPNFEFFLPNEKNTH